MQNFYNNNFWGYGVGGRQTNYDPRTPQGQAAIQSNFDMLKEMYRTLQRHFLRLEQQKELDKQFDGLQLQLRQAVEQKQQ